MKAFLKARKKTVLMLIFLLALILRVWNLGIIPEAIDEDEMALGYYAYSLVKNGTDEYGNRFPLYFESIGDYKYGVYSYFAAIPIFFLGLNPFSTRLIAAIAGSLSVLAIYYLVLRLYKKKNMAVLASFILAISPTHIHFSRVAYNNVLGLLFAIISVYFFVKFIEEGMKKDVSFSLLFFVLSIFTYQAFRIFMPVFFVLLLISLFRSIPKKRIKTAGGFVVVLIFIVVLSLIPPESRARTQEISLFFDKQEILEQISEDTPADTSLLFTRIMHNKVFDGTLKFTERYVSSFDPIFLFFEASGSTTRHSTPGVGLLYFVELPLLLLALFYTVKYLKSKYVMFPLLWVATGPLSSAIVVEARSPTRMMFTIVGFVILLAVGITIFVEKTKKVSKKLLWGGIILAYLLNFVYVKHQYMVHKLYHHPWYGDVGLKEMVNAVSDKYYDKYENVVISGGHYIPFLFYSKVSPKEFLANSEIYPKSKTKWNRVARFDKYYFNMPTSCPVAGKENTLYVCFGYKIPINGQVMEVFRYRDGAPAITLVEFIPLSQIDSSRVLPERLEVMKQIDGRYIDNIIPKDSESFWPM